jgi:vanillate/3-O-methylgallate O-demethylase
LGTYQDQLEKAGSPVKLHSIPRPPRLSFPYPAEYTNWRSEQKGRVTGAVIFDQSYHMDDLYIRGPDRLKLLSDTSVNSYTNFGANMAKQYVATNAQGYVVCDAILFGLSDDEAVMVGLASTTHWLQYHAKKGRYNVSLEVEQASHGMPPTPKRLYRYNIEGPNAWKVLEKAAGKKLDLIKFFRMGALPIAGNIVRALNHTMGGVPGQEMTGLELFGPYEQGAAVLEAILTAGKEFGLMRGGAFSYASAILDSGWIGFPFPAIYSPDLRGYREWLHESSFEAFLPIAGSFRSENIEDYYATPWDLGYGRVVKFDHDFIGRAALEKLAGNPARTKVWIKWNDEDAARVVASGEIGSETGAKHVELPFVFRSFDQVLVNNKMVGLAVIHGHSATQGGITSLGYANVSNAADGTQVEILWGDPDGAASNPYVYPHKQTRVRGTLFTHSPQQ